MTLATWFWLFYVISLVFGVWREYGPVGAPFPRWGWFATTYLLFGLLGWKAFGSPIQ